MKAIEKPWIKLKEFIDSEDFELINQLQEQCINEDQIALKLEIDYKLGFIHGTGKSSCRRDINEFMYFDGDQLIGYAGICSFGGKLEVNGMVKPEYRGLGIFKTLIDLVVPEGKRRKSGSILLLSDRKSSSGQAFIKSTGAKYKYSEFEMYLREDNFVLDDSKLLGITFRKATNDDAQEIARQNEFIFRDDDNDIENDNRESETGMPDEDLMLPEEEEKRGMIIYIAEKDGQAIGKVNLQLISQIGGIYGFGVLPEHRGKGYGRAILLKSIEKLKEANASQVMLQVEAEKANALKLYKSCGFVEVSTMDYFEL